jgi:hypothetical protein
MSTKVISARIPLEKESLLRKAADLKGVNLNGFLEEMIDRQLGSEDIHREHKKNEGEVGNLKSLKHKDEERSIQEGNAQAAREIVGSLALVGIGYALYIALKN